MESREIVDSSLKYQLLTSLHEDVPKTLKRGWFWYINVDISGRATQGDKTES